MSESTEHHTTSFSPFVLHTDRLIIIPTPMIISTTSYVKLYGSLHADPVFCNMAFAHHFAAREWSVEETKAVICSRDRDRCWKRRGMGDFAVGVRRDVVTAASREYKDDRGRTLQSSREGKQTRILEGGDLDSLISTTPDGQSFLDTIEWVGYAGVRDATTTSLPDPTSGDSPLPPWLKMIELRYGVAPKFWGRGLAQEAAEAVMDWAVSERGVQRFIAETERANSRSGRVLEKMGFRLSGTEYWKEPSEVEWERIVL
ncbi:Nn.00g061200.m01.CDS01 [Neocucurbitaria sp. VM-36]